jgi:hypothetical protein
MAGLSFLKDITRTIRPLLVFGEWREIMRKAKTHFEQVPLEIVKKIAEQQERGGVVKLDIPVTVDSPGTKTETADDNQFHGLQYPSWQKLCQEALIELDLEKLKERVAAAETAIFLRFQELSRSGDGHAERQALSDVSSSLRFLKRDVLKFPDWEPTAQDQSGSSNA